MVSETFPNSYTSLKVHNSTFKTLRVIIFWVRVTHKMLNVNWEKIHSIILCVTCHGLRNFPWLIHIPSKHSWIFETLQVIIFLVRVTRKMQPQNKGPGMLWGQSYVLPMTWGVEAYGGAPFGRHAALRLFHFVIVSACNSVLINYNDFRTIFHILTLNLKTDFIFLVFYILPTTIFKHF